KAVVRWLNFVMLRQPILQLDRRRNVAGSHTVAALVGDRFFVRLLVGLDTNDRYMKSVVNREGDSAPATAEVDDPIAFPKTIHLEKSLERLIRGRLVPVVVAVSIPFP